MDTTIVPVAERPFEELVKLNAPVIHRTISAYTAATKLDLAYEDLRQEMHLTMWGCQRSFRWGGRGGQAGHDRQFFYYLQRAMYRRLRKIHLYGTRAKRSAVLVSIDAEDPEGSSHLDSLVDTHELQPETHAVLASLSPRAQVYVGCRLAGVPVAQRLSKHDARVARDELDLTFRSGE